VNSAILGSSPSSPFPAFDHQDRIFSTAFSMLDAAIAARAFPGASIAITHQGRLIARKTFGRCTFEQNDPNVSVATLFDLASLTKVVATTTMAMILYERGLLDLEAPATAIVPEFTSNEEKDLRRRDVSIRMLLAHSSGLPAYEKLFLEAHHRDDLLHAAFTTPLAAGPGTAAEYSDIGFIILGIALERIAGESLDRFCQREIFGPLDMASTTFNPPPEIRPHTPPTADERASGADTPFDKLRASPVREMPEAASVSQCSTFRNRIIQGEVQDENASVLGGVAGHAGLFSTADDLARFAHVILNAGRPILRPETVALFTRRESAPAGTSRALGWDTPSSPSQSGKYLSPASFGHLGYTGTSLWIDPTRQLSITLLTNRTWPDCANQAIRQVRPQFHDAVIEALGVK
jgi:serine-type D-Ala-D-Ala carboxypeptidase